MIDLKSKEGRGYFPKTISINKSKDTGMAIVLICLLLGYLSQNNKFFVLSILLQIINMIFPKMYKPLAKIWFGISNILGTIVTKLLLTIIFFILVTPIGIIRRMLKIDSMQQKKWRKGIFSVFKVREHIFKPEHIENPY